MAALVVLCLAGCGRVVAQKATEQLIAGDAVDRSIAQIDFRILTGKKVFLDTQYVNNKVPGVGFVTSEYIVSSLRQKMMCDGCLLAGKGRPGRLCRRNADRRSGCGRSRNRLRHAAQQLRGPGGFGDAGIVRRRPP